MVISCKEIWQNEVACIRPYLSEFFLISCFLGWGVGGQVTGQKGLQLGSSVAGSRGETMFIMCAN